MAKIKIKTGKRFRANRVDAHYDTIVVGSGMGGLTNAALLAKLGKKVCVLEQHYTAGGYTHAYEREGYEWDVGVHYVGEVHKPSTLRRLFDVISEGRLEWAAMEDEYDRVILGDDEFSFVAGRDNFAKMLKERFPGEDKVIDDYIQLIRDVSRYTPKFFAGQAMPRWMARMYNMVRPLLVPKVFFQSTRDVLEGMTSNQSLISVLTGQWGNYGQVPKDASFLIHALIAKHYLAGGAYPVGGSSEISRTIIPTIQQNGGEVFTYADVEEILVKNNTAYGVRMADGTEITADNVVSAAGFYNTAKKLLPSDVQHRLGVDDWVNKVPPSSAHLCIYAGFKGTTEELGLSTTNLWIYPDGDHEANLKKYNDDYTQDFPLVYISFPSAKDPDWNNRYPGKSTVEVVTPARMDWFKEWEGSQWQKRGEDYETFKTQFADRLMEKLFERHPQLRDKLDYFELSTPLSTNWYQKTSAGEMLSLDHGVDRFKHSFLHPITPIKNLFMTGSDVMTAGVGGALMAGMMTTCAMQGRKAGQVVKLLKDYQEPVKAAAPAAKKPTAKAAPEKEQA